MKGPPRRRQPSGGVADCEGVDVPERTCAGCGVAIEPGRRERNRKKWCSEACRVATYRASTPSYRERQAEQRATSCRVYVEPCDVCGELRTWRTARRLSRACSPECKKSVKAKRVRDRYAANVEAERERIYAWRKSRSVPCVDCGGVVASVDKERCGRCQRKAAARGASEMHRKWRSATAFQSWQHWRVAATPPLALPSPPSTPEVREPRPRRFVAGSCATCGSPFVVEAWFGRYCSRNCTPQRRQWIPRSRRFDLYERDDWTCQICGDPVPLVTTYLHPLGASLDHVIPRSRGGSHAAENLRMAHMLCNSLRGAPETGIAA